MIDDISDCRSSGEGDPLTVDDVRQLLVGYGVALDAADALPLLVRFASRPRRWWFFDSFRRFPRPTVATSTMVTHHMRRSSAALVRRYRLLAATRGLTEEEQRASELVDTFHASLPEVRWKLIVPAGLIAVFIMFQVLLGVVTHVVADAVRARDSDGPSADVVRGLAESLIRMGAAVPTPGSFVDVFTQFGKAGISELLALAATIIVAAYLVVRPLSPAFRLKRTIFNLASSGRVDLRRTTSTWNVNRSLGLYQLEGKVFARLGARVPREIDFDLLVSAVPAAVLAWLLWPGRILIPGNTVTFAALLALPAVLVAARIAWLVQTGRTRRRAARPVEPAAGFRVPSTENVVEARSVTETSALGLASFFCFWMIPFDLNFVVPSPVWIRLVRERRDLDRAQGHGADTIERLPFARVWLPLGSALLLWVVPPVALTVHLTHLMRLQPPGVGSARRTRAWLVPLSAATTVFLAFDLLYLATHFGGRWNGVGVIPTIAMFAVAFAAVQHEHNALVAHIGTPLPFDEPQPAKVGSLPSEAYTSWPRRAVAAAIDATPILVLGSIGVAIALATDEYICEPDWCGSVATDTGRMAMLVAALVASAYGLWNWGYRQGRTGSSVGKSLLKFTVVSEKNGQPIGFVLSTVRQLLHIVDFFSLGIGYLLPLWDAQRQTLADKMVSTVCFSRHRSGAGGGETLPRR